jgi:hypothetical protein
VVSSVKEIAAPQTSRLVPALRITTIARDTSYTNLRELLLPNGAKTVEPSLKAYVEGLFKPPVAVGIILVDARFAIARNAISKCIRARQVGNPCAEGSLSALVK